MDSYVLPPGSASLNNFLTSWRILLKLDTNLTPLQTTSVRLILITCFNDSNMARRIGHCC
jgi:hypothetical protein